MNAPLSSYHVVEYHFLSDTLSVRELSEYLTASHRCFDQLKVFDTVILSLHPSREGAEEAWEVWQEKRDTSPTTPRQRLEQLEIYIEGLRSQISD